MFGTTTVPTQFVGTRVIQRQIKTRLLAESIHCTHHPQLWHARCLPVTRAAISRSPSTVPLCKVERLCPQKWVVVLFPQLGQFPPARAFVRLDEARCKRMQLTKQTESETNPILEMNQGLRHCLPFPHQLSPESADERPPIGMTYQGNWLKAHS